MMTLPHTPTSRITEAQKESPNKARVEAELKALQDKHRLAIHILEFSPQETQAYLRNNTAAKLADPAHYVAAKELAVLSMSLVPATGEPRQAMIPYGSFPFYMPKLGYLLDVSDDVHYAHPARVLQVGRVNLDTKDNVYNKRHLSEKMLDKERGISMANGSLDMLGELYNKERTTRDDNIIPHNEILVAANMDHLKAIVVPSYDSPSGVGQLHWHMPAARLVGALAGLEHLMAPLSKELPVMLYHIDGERQGECSYLGMGGKELLCVALDEIASLQTKAAEQPRFDNKFRKILRDYAPYIAEVTGINIDSPLGKQARAIERAMTKFSQTMPTHGAER